MNFIEKIAAEKRSGFEFERKSLTESILREKNIALIAEIKRKSPSQGQMRDIDPAKFRLIKQMLLDAKVILDWLNGFWYHNCVTLLVPLWQVTVRCVQ
jgi:hypothetical protein